MIKKILSFFRPQEFRNDNYTWFLNQSGHIIGSALATYYLSFISHYAWVFMGLFWIFWEVVYQYNLVKNKRDLTEDLSFELMGVITYFNLFIFIPIAILILIVVMILTRYKK